MAGATKRLKTIAQGLAVNSDGAQYSNTPTLRSPEFEDEDDDENEALI
jgi:hypothetical protein